MFLPDSPGKRDNRIGPLEIPRRPPLREPRAPPSAGRPPLNLSPAQHSHSRPHLLVLALPDMVRLARLTRDRPAGDSHRLAAQQVPRVPGKDEHVEEAQATDRGERAARSRSARGRASGASRARATRRCLSPSAPAHVVQRRRGTGFFSAHGLYSDASSSRATSARSWGRAVILLFLMSSCRPIVGILRPSISTSTRLGQASSNATPSIAVRMSMRQGATPIWNTIPVV